MLTKLAAIVAGAVIALGIATPAHAEKFNAYDSLGDVVSLDDTGAATPAPDNTDADIVKTVVNHSKRRVVIKLKLRDLTSLASNEGIDVLTEIHSNKNPQAAWLTKFGSSKPRIDVISGPHSPKCRGSSAKVAPSKNLVKFSIPRTCLKNPRWIKVSVLVLAGVDTSVFFDDALRSKASDLSAPAKFTPKLKRG